MAATVLAKNFDALITQPFAVGDGKRAATLTRSLGTIAEFTEEIVFGIDGHTAASL